MDLNAALIVTGSVFLWGALSARLQRADLTAPIVFVAIGALLTLLGVVDTPEETEGLKLLVEVTLVWVLFSDAARVPVRELRDAPGHYVRLLAVGLPLTVLAGWGLAWVMFPAAGAWVALLVAAALAPTDAALGIPVVTNPVVPERVRRLITVESGLNDGIATPVVMLAIAAVAAEEGFAGSLKPGTALVSLLGGVLVGGLVGLGGGGTLRWTRRYGWATEDLTGVAVLALALVAYLAALVLDVNGFVAAFCGGLAFGAAAGRRGPSELVFVEQSAWLVSLLVWLAFGAVVGPIILERATPMMAVYAVLSLTVIRMAPVALACLGAGFDRSTVLFIGWFGPRGLATLVFALLALEDLGPTVDQAVAVIGLTVLLSVVAHGLTAAPLAARYGRDHAATPSG
ncbi:MAG TPA: cation:proton antiporter [Nocardioides sp.]|uniref:cation:proton antiporter domain-containing protein n=1 Tax=Nocardioides sp. TaxID=35761 RepID=UPI002C7A4BE1|nr:cation:proton antiporter [Nocardioides sp.]HQR27804.1 cation:proton antiporter [Nocardioides sp.]